MEQKQPKRITYLFGAGASCGNRKLLNDLSPSGIPVVEDFNIDIGLFLDEIKNKSPKMSNEEYIEQFDKLKERFQATYSNFSNMYSFDTYAKSLSEKGQEDELTNLKLLLKAYLIYRQLVSSPDPRYDLLFATLINKGSLPAHVNFLSWNYDTQVETSLSKFTNHPSKFLDFIQLGFKEQNIYKASLLKLNGTISIKNDLTKVESFIPENHKNIDDRKERAMKEIALLHSPNISDFYSPKIYFSWENKDEFNQVLTYSEKIIKNTDILIIIGYSFPTLNRTIDRQLLKSLNAETRIFVQCKDEVSYRAIKEKIFSLLPPDTNEKITLTQTRPGYIGIDEVDRVSFVENNAEFYVPYEFEPA